MSGNLNKTFFSTRNFNFFNSFEESGYTQLYSFDFIAHCNKNGFDLQTSNIRIGISNLFASILWYG